MKYEVVVVGFLVVQRAVFYPLGAEARIFFRESLIGVPADVAKGITVFRLK